MVIILKTFYIFKLNKHYLNIAKENPNSVFILLNSIYTYNKSDIVVAFDLFKEICSPINKEFFNKYYYDKLREFEEYTKFKNTHMYNNYLSDEISKMEINNSHIKIKSNIVDNIFLLNMLDSVFICDFKTNCYNLLNRNVKKIV